MNVIYALQAVLPDEMEVLKRRYQILKLVASKHPIGRRTVSILLNLTERTVRADAQNLLQSGLVQVYRSGMELTEKGYSVLHQLHETIVLLDDFHSLESQILNLTGVRKVSIVAGNSDENLTVKEDIGILAARHFRTIIQNDSIIAITGGSTMAQFVKAVPVQVYQARLVAAARGSVGNKLEHQADWLAHLLAEKLDCGYRLMKLPDNLPESVLREMKNEPQLLNTLNQAKKADILVFGMGSAIKMAKRRQVSQDTLAYLQEKNAVGESFGYYFDQEGHTVYNSQTVGLNLEDILNIPVKIALAGGAKKALATLSICKVMQDIHLVIDEGCANEMLQLKKQKENIYL